MIIFRFIVLLFSLQSFVLEKDEIKAKLNEIIPDEISAVSYTHLTLPTTPYV